MFSNLNKAGIDVVTDRKMQDNSGMIEFKEKEKERHQHCYLSLKKVYNIEALFSQYQSDYYIFKLYRLINLIFKRRFLINVTLLVA